MTILSLLDPRGWFSGGVDRYRAKLTEAGGHQAASLDPRGQAIGADAALQVSAFWSGVRINAETIGTLPLPLFRKDSNGGRTAQVDHPLYKLLHDQPNADHTPMELFEGLAAYLVVGGNAYVRKETTGSRLTGLTLLRTPLVMAQRGPDGAFVYRYTDRGVTETYGEDEIMHVRGFGFGDDFGLSALSYARRTLGIALAADEVADRTFANGMKMSGWFKYKGGNGILTQAQREQARKLLVDPYVGAGNAAKVGILEGDFDWLAASMPMADAQLLESRRFGVEDVCRWLGVPPILIGHAAQGQTMWGSGVEAVILSWLVTGLRPYLVRIEQAINRSLLTAEDKAAGLYAEFNIDGLLRADSKARTENYARLGQNGILTRNEMRAMENLPPVVGGDTLTVQSNLVPIDKLGELASLPRLKEIDPGADLLHGSGQEAEGSSLQGKLNTHHDDRGRFSSADGGSSGGKQPSKKPSKKPSSLARWSSGLLGAAAAVVLIGALSANRHEVHLGDYESAMARLAKGTLKDQIAAPERAALGKYVASSSNINTSLRSGASHPDAAMIDAAIAKSSLSEPTVLFRGMESEVVDALTQQGLKPGAVLRDKAFLSTSLSPKIAGGFALQDDGKRDNAGYVFAIHAHRGAKALPLHGIGKSDEHEVLLPRDSGIRVLKVDHQNKLVQAELL